MIAVSASQAKTRVTQTGGADQQVVGSNSERNGLSVTLDSAAVSPLYLLLVQDTELTAPPTASATSFSYCLAAGGSWDGLVGGTLWTGAVRSFSAGAGKYGVVEL